MNPAGLRTLEEILLDVDGGGETAYLDEMQRRWVFSTGTPASASTIYRGIQELNFTHKKARGRGPEHSRTMSKHLQR